MMSKSASMRPEEEEEEEEEEELAANLKANAMGAGYPKEHTPNREIVLFAMEATRKWQLARITRPSLTALTQ